MTPAAEAFVARARADLAACELLAGSGHYALTVARSYYVMLYAASALLAERGLAFRRHQAVLSHFATEITRRGLLPGYLHTWFNQAALDRGAADYLPGRAFTEAQARESLRRAREFVAAAEALLPP